MLQGMFKLPEYDGKKGKGRRELLSCLDKLPRGLVAANLRYFAFANEMGLQESPQPGCSRHVFETPATLINERYKVESKIGEGSFSDVLRCSDKNTGTLVAAKQLKRAFKSAQAASETPELVALRKISPHPNILDLLESHFDPLTGKLTLIFHLMDSSLYDLITKCNKPLTEARAKNYIYQVIKGLNHIHSHGIFHRDVKPENILIKGNLIRISDFGSVKGIFNSQPHTDYISTRWYRSPECLLTTGYYGPKMDVWAIGCVFYELLTLKPLFPGSSEIDQVARINQVLGTPSSRLMNKFKKHKSRNIANFANKSGTGLNTLIPITTTEGARDVLKQMLIYDPDLRINIRRLIDHKYFSDYKDLEAQGGLLVSNSLPTLVANSRSNNFRNPALLSYLTNDRRRKKINARIKKKPVVNKETEARGKAAAASCSTLQSKAPIGSTRSVGLIHTQKAASKSNFPAGDTRLKVTSHPALAGYRDNRSMVTRSLRTDLGGQGASNRLAQAYQINPALVKLQGRLAKRGPLTEITQHRRA